MNKTDKLIPLPGKENDLIQAMENARSIGAYNIPKSPELIGRTESAHDTLWYFEDTDGKYYFKTEYGFEQYAETKKKRKNMRSDFEMERYFQMTRQQLRREEEQKNMTIFYENKETGMQAGLNNDGELFLGDSKSGYNLRDTPENRAYIKADFERYQKHVEVTY